MQHLHFPKYFHILSYRCHFLLTLILKTSSNISTQTEQISRTCSLITTHTILVSNIIYTQNSSPHSLCKFDNYIFAFLERSSHVAMPPYLIPGSSCCFYSCIVAKKLTCPASSVYPFPTEDPESSHISLIWVFSYKLLFTWNLNTQWRILMWFQLLIYCPPWLTIYYFSWALACCIQLQTLGEVLGKWMAEGKVLN